MMLDEKCGRGNTDAVGGEILTEPVGKGIDIPGHIGDLILIRPLLKKNHYPVVHDFDIPVKIMSTVVTHVHGFPVLERHQAPLRIINANAIDKGIIFKIIPYLQHDGLTVDRAHLAIVGPWLVGDVGNEQGILMRHGAGERFGAERVSDTGGFFLFGLIGAAISVGLVSVNTAAQRKQQAANHKP